MTTIVSQIRAGNVTLVTVSSDLIGSPIYYHWYLDGAYLGMTLDPSRSISLSPGDQSRVDIEDTLDPAFDPQANAPTQYPARRTIDFVRSIDPEVNKYKVEQQKNGGSWTTIAVVQDDPSQWEYRVLSPRLDDLATYAWRVTPIDTAGNLGTVGTLAAELIVRTPDAPNFEISFDPGTLETTFSAA